MQADAFWIENIFRYVSLRDVYMSHGDVDFMRPLPKCVLLGMQM